MNSTQSLQPLRCIKCNRIIAYVNGDVSVRCQYDKEITLYVNGEVSRGFQTISASYSYKTIVKVS